jgi:signal transduction histidine kinase
LSKAADSLNTNLKRIMSLWEERVNKEVSAAERVSNLILRDMLPVLLQQLATTIATQKAGGRINFRQELAFLGTAKEHGQQRADTEVYTLAEVIVEFQILRQVIFEVLEEIEPLSKLDRDTIINLFEQTVNESACMFADLQTKNRERFTLTLVHDLRSPLFVIKMACQLAQSQLNDPPTIIYAFEKVEGNSKKLESMITALLDVGRIRSGKGFVVNATDMRLDELVKDTVTHLTEAYGNRFEARADKQILGCWDKEGLRRIIENLAVNALKYGNKSSPIVICATKKGNNAVLTCHNEGNPITLDEQQKIFGTFDRSSAASHASGWGLGLTLVKGMAEAHKGTVRVESSPETGTDFIVELPIAMKS